MTVITDVLTLLVMIGAVGGLFWEFSKANKDSKTLHGKLEALLGKFDQLIALFTTMAIAPPVEPKPKKRTAKKVKTAPAPTIAVPVVIPTEMKGETDEAPTPTV